jgi:iron complex transport system ATP-binding protein
MNDYPLLELRGARVVRDGRVILDVDRLVFREGEHVAILGPNGSGKSTLIGLLTHDVRPLAAEAPPVRFLGRERWGLFEARSLLGVVSNTLQNQNDRAITAFDVVLSGFFGSVGLHFTQHPTASMLTRVAELMEHLEIGHLAERTMDTLSTGEARRALIARALVHDPRVLVLDEPCDGLDPSATYHVLRTLRRLSAEGRSLVLVTHHVDDILPEVRRIVMLDGGRIVADGPKSDVLTSEALSDLFGMPARLEERDGWYRLW